MVIDHWGVLYHFKLIWKLIMMKDHLKVLNVIFGIHHLLMYLLLSFFQQIAQLEIPVSQFLCMWTDLQGRNEESNKCYAAGFQKGHVLQWRQVKWSCYLCMQHANCNHQSFGDCSPTALQTPLNFSKHSPLDFNAYNVTTPSLKIVNEVQEITCTAHRCGPHRTIHFGMYNHVVMYRKIPLYILQVWFVSS
jgi:hypothetical protein